MIKYLKYTVLLVILINNSIFSQSYKKIFGNTNTWNEYYQFEIGFTTKYKTDGDTIINGNTYKKIYGGEMMNEYDTPDYYLRYLMREDTLEQKVFFLNFNYTDTIEKLLYDYSIEIGDTVDVVVPFSDLMEGYLTAGGTVSLELDSIIVIDDISNTDSVLVFKRLDYYSGYNVYWIKGVGSRAGIGRNAACWPPQDQTQLICAFKDEEQTFHYVPYSEPHNCFLYVDVSSNELDNTINVFPNPANNYITINGNNITKIEVINILGLLEKEFNLNQNQITLDITDLNKGIYFLKIFEGKNEYVKKIILQ